MKIAILCLVLALTAAATAATPTAGGPTSILIAYRSEPAAHSSTFGRTLA